MASAVAPLRSSAPSSFRQASRGHPLLPATQLETRRHRAHLVEGARLGERAPVGGGGTDRHPRGARGADRNTEGWLGTARLRNLAPSGSSGRARAPTDPLPLELSGATSPDKALAQPAWVYPERLERSRFHTIHTLFLHRQRGLTPPPCRPKTPTPTDRDHARTRCPPARRTLVGEPLRRPAVEPALAGDVDRGVRQGERRAALSAGATRPRARCLQAPVRLPTVARAQLAAQ